MEIKKERKQGSVITGLKKKIILIDVYVDI
jgi:hypothetical protein